MDAKANGFAPGVVEAISFAGTMIAMWYNYPNNPILQDHTECHECIAYDNTKMIITDANIIYMDVNRQV